MKLSKEYQQAIDACEPTRASSEIKELYVEYPLNIKIERDWKTLLSKEDYTILFKEGTEPPFNNLYHDNHRAGVYYCKACHQPLFGSEAKFDSGTGWPSFYAPLRKESITYKVDFSFFQSRVEAKCSCCGGHLGHVFTDGIPPSYLRFCMNSGALDFIEHK